MCDGEPTWKPVWYVEKAKVAQVSVTEAKYPFQICAMAPLSRSLGFAHSTSESRGQGKLPLSHCLLNTAGRQGCRGEACQGSLCLSCL